MDEKEIRRSGSRSGIKAATAVIFLGVIVVLGVIIIFSAFGISSITNKIASNDVQGAYSEYSSMNPVGKLVFRRNAEKAFLSKYEEYLEKGYIATAKEMTVMLDEEFNSFSIADYSSKLAACASKALWNGEFKEAADAARFITDNIPGADLSVLRSGLEASLETAASEMDFEAVDYIMEYLEAPDKSRIVCGLALAAYNCVFTGDSPDYSASALKKLESVMDVCTKYSLSTEKGGDVLLRFLNYYSAGCIRYKEYFEVYKLSKAVESDLDNASKYFEMAVLGESADSGATDAATAFNYASRALETAKKFDSSQLGVTEYIKLCSDYADNMTAMGAWQNIDDFNACVEKQEVLEESRSNYDNLILTNIAGFEDYSDTALNLNLQALYS